ncbi:unnamed protein product [Tuber aestivum]|uniref:Uncharacterized protein n=1 Tax=Tuber aestivum TaxID=59557 RepID=A0A292Q879_9PEZI|nr:unnamed protein product [Tuber aestivum]
MSLQYSSRRTSCSAASIAFLRPSCFLCLAAPRPASCVPGCGPSTGPVCGVGGPSAGRISERSACGVDTVDEGCDGMSSSAAVIRSFRSCRRDAWNIINDMMNHTLSGRYATSSPPSFRNFSTTSIFSRSNRAILSTLKSFGISVINPSSSSSSSIPALCPVHSLPSITLLRCLFFRPPAPADPPSEKCRECMVK